MNEVSIDNIYEYFAELRWRLHAVSISVLPKARSNGVRFTGKFNIDGFTYTVGAATIDDLCWQATDKAFRHRLAIGHSQDRKRMRCAKRFMKRYPGAKLPFWLNISDLLLP